MSSAIIGSEKGNPMIKGLLDMYDRTVILPLEKGKEKPEKVFEEGKDGELLVHGYATSNYYYTYYILTHYPQFRLGNKFQDMGDFVIYPKEYFEIGKLLGNHYAVHLCAGEWRIKADTSKTLKGRVKSLLSKNQWIFDKVQIIVRNKRYKRLNQQIPFYPYLVAQKNGTQLPSL